MAKLKEPTYKRFITGQLSRFDARNFALFGSKKEATRPNEKKVGEPDNFYHRGPSKNEKRKGYEQKDYALVWAARTIDTLAIRNLLCRDLEVAKTKVDVSNTAAITQQIKSVAHWLGADLVGICEVNHSWIYSHWGDISASYSGRPAYADDPIEIPSWLKCAVVIAVEMDYEAIRRSPAIQPAPSLGYSKMAFVAPSLATYIRELGYHAMPCSCGFALMIPLAIDAGLGELGRNGLLITEQFGPRVRICSVFTELPLQVDSPIDIGVQAFCERCLRCAEACPSKAIMSGERTDQARGVSNNINVLKWPIKALNCSRFWDKNKGSCSNCIRVCPFNKPQGWLHSLVRKTVKTTPIFNRFFVKVDRMLGYGKQVIK